MAEMRMVISSKANTKQIKLSEEQVARVKGLKIGETFKGDAFGLDGYILKITGGTDEDGFPMRKDMQGTRKKRLLLSNGPGYKPKEKGVRRRKMIRGNTVENNIAQLNVVVEKAGKKKFEEIFKKEEATTEEKKE